LNSAQSEQESETLRLGQLPKHGHLKPFYVANPEMVTMPLAYLTALFHHQATDAKTQWQL
jgi:hypothetical protein